MKNDEMPSVIWAKTYESGTGHGEWDDYQPFDPSFAAQYHKTAKLIEMIEGMK